jgi:hypothetical protein
LDNDTFDLIYKNTSNIVWSLNDKEAYQKLTESKKFNEKVSVISLQETSN